LPFLLPVLAVRLIVGVFALVLQLVALVLRLIAATITRVAPAMARRISAGASRLAPWMALARPNWRIDPASRRVRLLPTWRCGSVRGLTTRSHSP